MKPWEETWIAEGEDVLTGPKADCEWSSNLRHVTWGEGDCEARARLAAAAPEMFRLLLELEWIWEDGRQVCGICCRLMAYGHREDCALHTALEKAASL